MPMLARIEEGRYRSVAPLVRNAKDGSVLALVPGGEFEMGDGSDKHRVQLDAYYIGVYGVTNAQYARFVKETWHGGRREWSVESGIENHPVVNVNWDDATAYAAWAGCELPTDSQWEKAARGPKNLIYPWGDEWDASKCRNFGNKGNGQTCAVWEYPEGMSGYGTHQQSGNVWEWCRDWYGDKYYSEAGAGKNPSGPATGSIRVIRGGGWRSDDAGIFRAAYRNRGMPATRGDCNGFRLVRKAGEVH